MFLKLDWGIIWPIVNIVVFYLLLRKFLFGPVSEVMEKRKKMISSDLDDAAQTKAEAEEIKQEYEKNLAQAKDEAGQIVSDARARAKNEYQNKMDQTKEEIADFLTGQRKEKDESEWLVTIRPELRIIEEEVFDKAQDILKGRHDSFKITHERQSNKYLFSTLIKCKECGWSFRRTVRQYKNTYVRWVCSGHNGKGADSCPNAVTVDEEELIQALQEYFQEILSKKKKVINYVIKEFQRVYKAKDENIEYEKQLNAELNKLHKSREKYMDMYTDDLISREELNEKIGGMRKEIERLENELKMVSYHLTKGEQLEAILNSTFKQLEDITDVHEMTNAQLKRLINKIEVDKDGNVDIYLHLIGDLGLDETVLIEGDKNTEEKGTKKVPNSYNHT